MDDRQELRARAYINMGKALSVLSHDAQTKLGGILVRNSTGVQVVSAYNGFVSGAPDNDLPNTRPDKYEYMIHVEQNLLSHCANEGIATKDTTFYCSLSPCINCTRLLYQAGVTGAVCEKLYTDFDKVLNMKDIKVVHKVKNGLNIINFYPQT